MALALAAASAGAPAATMHATVVQVIEGDTLVVQSAGKDKPGRPVTVRLAGIDAPEICQDGGIEARDALAAIVRGQALVLRTSGRDASGATLATVRIGEVTVNERMVAEGQAWALRVKWDKGPYVAHERMAATLHRGLHADRQALAPATFRARHGPCRR